VSLCNFGNFGTLLFCCSGSQNPEPFLGRCNFGCLEQQSCKMDEKCNLSPLFAKLQEAEPTVMKPIDQLNEKRRS